MITTLHPLAYTTLHVTFSRDLRVTSLLKIFQTIVRRQKLRFDGYIDYIVVLQVFSQSEWKKSGSGIEWSGTFHLNQPGTPIGWTMWKRRKKYTTHPIKYLRLDNPITSLLINKWDHQAISSVNWLFKTCLALWLCRCFQHTRRIWGLFQTSKQTRKQEIVRNTESLGWSLGFGLKV